MGFRKEWERISCISRSVDGGMGEKAQPLTSTKSSSSRYHPGMAVMNSGTSPAESLPPCFIGALFSS